MAKLTADQRAALGAAFDARDSMALTLRLPRVLHGALVTLAARDRRSLNSQIVAILADCANAALDPRGVLGRGDHLARYLAGELHRMEPRDPRLAWFDDEGAPVAPSTRTGFDPD